MPLDLTTRAGKGSPLSAAEVDQNLTDIETLVNTIEADVSDEDVDDLSTRLDAAEVDIDDAESDIDTAEADIIDHETRVSANEAHVAASSGNPHAVTKGNVGLGNLTNDIQLKRATQWHDDDVNIPAKATPVDADIALIEDSAASYVKKKVTWANIKSVLKTYFDGLYHDLTTIGIADDNLIEIDDADVADNDYAKFTADGLEGREYSEVRSDLNVEDGADVTDATNIASSIVGVAGKATPVNADSIAIIDSAAGNVLKETTFTQLKAFMKTYWDGLYHALTTVGIANTNLVKIDHAAVADDDYAKFTANGLEGREKSEVLSDLNVEDGADITDATNVASTIVGVGGKATPHNSDSIAIIDSQASNVLRKTTWSQVKAALKTYYDGVYLAIGAKAADADLLDSFNLSYGASANTIPRRGGASQIAVGYVNLSSPSEIGDGNITKIVAEQNNDGNTHHAGAVAVRTFINVENGATVGAGNDNYSTAWINRSDWTSVHIGSNAAKNTNSNVTHSLGVPLSNLLVKLLVSPTGNDSDCFEEHANTSFSGSNNWGWTTFGVDNNNVLVQTATLGFRYIDGAGAGITINTQDWYYKIVVVRLF